MTRRHPLPAEVYALVEHTPATVLLEGGKQNSSETTEKPWTQLFVEPAHVCVAHSLTDIPSLFAKIEDAIAAGQYAAGFFTYECGPCFEPTASAHVLPKNRPLAWFGIYDRSYVFDHEKGEFAGAEPPLLEQFRASALAAAAGSSLPPEPDPEISAQFALTESAYAERIAAIHEWIRAGDVYQLNFTAPFKVEMQGSIAARYARLRERQPVDYGAFIHFESGHHILSFSPELFFRVETAGLHSGARRIMTRPMKGTAQRGRTTKEDRAIAQGLANDPKNRSENLMIVDLVRNDLGRVARFGTVRAESLFAVERYPTLWQMTSTVSAELRPEACFYDIFRALFPCGSITGAPKVRAMQLIAELEDGPRGVYTGAIGFFSPHETVFNVAIRTLELDGVRGIFGAGSGIVIDSVSAEEYRECLLKAKFLTGPVHRATSPVEGSAAFAGQPDSLFLIETLLWDRGYPLIDLHLDRLEDSAEYFGFACDRAAVKAALESHARQFTNAAPRKVRLLLGDGGELQIANETLASGSTLHLPQDCHPERVRQAGEAKDLRLPSRSAPPAPVGRVCVAETRTDPADPLLYHKTTQRPLYALEYMQAAQRGYDDVLFCNLRGELTEGAISNVFVEKDGRWLTPPIESGLLAGVFRRHLLETRPDIEERILTLDDLRNADAVYLCNAVRGLRRLIVAE